MVTARTTAKNVQNRLGVDNIDADIDEETLNKYITHASAYIERYTQRDVFSSDDDDLVEVIATDLVAAMVLEHMAAGKYYGGADYRLGPWSTNKSTGGSQLVLLARQYRANADKGLKVLGNASFFRFATG